MNNYPTDPGTPPQAPVDHNPTRYFPPQEDVGTSRNGADGTAPQPSHYTEPLANNAPYTPPAPSTYGAANGTNPLPQAMTAGRGNRDRSILGLALVGGGILFILQQFSIFSNFGDFVLLLIGGIFMYAYFNTRPAYRVGFLIPGSILLGIGVGEALESLAFMRLWGGGDITAVTLGLGFCLIWFFERRHWWALIPGGILTLAGLSEMWVFGKLWPLALIALGGYLLYDQSRKRQAR